MNYLVNSFIILNSFSAVFWKFNFPLGSQGNYSIKIFTYEYEIELILTFRDIFRAFEWFIWSFEILFEMSDDIMQKLGSHALNWFNPIFLEVIESIWTRNGAQKEGWAAEGKIFEFFVKLATKFSCESAKIFNSMLMKTFQCHFRRFFQFQSPRRDEKLQVSVQFSLKGEFTLGLLNFGL